MFGVNNLCFELGYIHMISQGYKYMFDDSLVTVWSAPNYCYRSLCARNKCHIKGSCVFRCGNVASILQFTDADNRTPKLFEAVPDDKRVIPARQVDLERTQQKQWKLSGSFQVTPYFL